MDTQPNTSDQSVAESNFCKERICKILQPPISLDAPILDDAVRFVCVSDTHERFAELLPQIPNGDVFIHCGDFTNAGQRKALELFNEQIGQLFKYQDRCPINTKLSLPGTTKLASKMKNTWTTQTRTATSGPGTASNFSQIVYIFTIHLLRCTEYVSPYHLSDGWDFYRSPGAPILSEFLKIPRYDSATPVDVLLTHTPPLGHNDAVLEESPTGALVEEHLGSADLLEVVEERVRPKYHIFGHIHGNNGLTTNNCTVFVNSAVCDHGNQLAYPPIIFDIPLPSGYSKQR